MRRPLAAPGRRMRGGLLVVLLCLLAVAGRLVQLQGLTPAYAEDAVDQRLRTTTVTAPRGAITDRDGEPLALSVSARAVYGEPRTIARAQEQCTRTERPCDPRTLAEQVAPLLDLDVDDVARKLGDTSTAFVYLARGLEAEVGNAVRALRLPGVGVLTEQRRTHPAGDLAASVVGYTDAEGRGLGGVESSLEDVLHGVDGRTRAAVDQQGRIIPTGETEVTAPVPGRDVQLTIDRDLQYYAQDLLAKKVQETDAENGTVVVMDVQTGELHALATAPSFDPDDRSGVPAERLGNPAVRDVYEPGSVAKIMTAAAALEHGVTTPDEVFDVPDRYVHRGRSYKDSHPHPLERLTFTGILVKSSNTGTIQVAERLGEERLHEAVTRFGYGAKSGLGLPGEGLGRVPDVEDWSNSSLPTISIGQGISGTVMNAVGVYQTIANDGVRVTPRVVKAVAGPDGRPVERPVSERVRVVSPEIAETVQRMLEGVVTEEGTAAVAAVPGYRVAGKTGTAQRVVDGRYAPGNYTSSFIGFAPADAPRLVVAVVVQGTGKKDYYGGTVAGPVFRDVMSFALRDLEVPPTGTTPAPLCLEEGCPRSERDGD